MTEYIMNTLVFLLILKPVLEPWFDPQQGQKFCNLIFVIVVIIIDCYYMKRVDDWIYYEHLGVLVSM